MKNLENKIDELIKEFANRHNCDACLKFIQHPELVHDTDEFTGEPYDWYTSSDIDIEIFDYKKKLNNDETYFETFIREECKGGLAYAIYQLYCEEFNSEHIQLPIVWFDYK